MAALGLACLFLLLATGCGSADPSVVVYTSQDQVYSEPILREFTAETGIRVLAVYDSEAVKTVGLTSRLIAERSNPRCDLFWNNEELRTWQLAARDVFSTNHPWRSFGYRSRRIVINTNLLSPSGAPAALEALTNAAWRGKVALAYPLFGTTATHFLALRHHWGEAKWEAWCRALAANAPLVVDGNSVVVQLVGKGEAAIGLTDYDDIRAGQRQGFPITALPTGEDALFIPNTAAIVRGAPNLSNAVQLLDFLTRPDTLHKLVEAGAIEGVSPPSSSQALPADYPAILEDLDAATATLKAIFLRN